MKTSFEGDIYIKYLAQLNTEKSAQTSRSDQRPLDTTSFQYYLVPDNILTATSVFLVLPWRLLAVALAT